MTDALGCCWVASTPYMCVWRHPVVLLVLQLLARHAAAAAFALRRRAARALGAWAPRLEAGDRPAAYAALLSALGDADAAVRLAAVAALRALVDDFGFDGPQFLPAAGGVMTALAGMLVESEELDTQTQVTCGRAALTSPRTHLLRCPPPRLLRTLPRLLPPAWRAPRPQVFSLLNLLIERLGPDVRPFCDAILQLLPRVWQAAEGQSLLRIQVRVRRGLSRHVWLAARARARVRGTDKHASARGPPSARRCSPRCSCW